MCKPTKTPTLTEAMLDLSEELMWKCNSEYVRAMRVASIPPSKRPTDDYLPPVLRVSP